MPKIIREKYENGVLVERQVEGSNTTAWYWLMLVVHTVIAITLAVLAIIAVHDSLTLRASVSEEDAMPAGCEQPRFRS
ncbi:MAG: antitoxin family protein [Dechloromonas sp.]|nr:antitoxin family protein [Dechloromonas sp.]